MALSKITDASVTNSTLTTTKLATPNLGRRNLVINGAMQVAQRGTSFTSVAGSAYHLDRYRTGMGDTSARFTVTQATAGLNGFGNSLKYDCTTAQSSLSNADARLFVTQRIEGQNLQQLKKGTSDAEKVTVSFYVKSTKTGTYILNLIDHDNNRQISKAYTISSSGTWESKSLTFDGDTTGALGDDNGNSFSLNWWLIAGTNYAGGTLATSWQAYAGASDYEDSAVGNVNLGDSTSNTWEITGIQLEANSAATPFEHRSYGEELALCERYFVECFSGDSNYESAGSGWAYNGGVAIYRTLRVQMRARPTLAKSASGTIHVSDDVNSSTNVSNMITNTNVTSGDIMYIECTASGVTTYRPYQVRANVTTTDASIKIDAEL
jgi:hypothetical protein